MDPGAGSGLEPGMDTCVGGSMDQVETKVRDQVMDQVLAQVEGFHFRNQVWTQVDPTSGDQFGSQAWEGVWPFLLWNQVLDQNEENNQE